MPQLEIELAPKINNRAIDRAGVDLQRRLGLYGPRAGDDFRDGFEQRLRQIDASTPASQAAREFGDAGTRGGREFADNATTAVRRGDWNGAARESARDFTRSFERQATPRVDINARSTAANAGGEAGDSFAGGFAGAGGLSRLAGKGGPIAAAILGGVLAGVKVIGPQVEAAMNLEASQDLTAARLGLDPATMAGVADAAARSFAENFGPSIEANLDTATAAIQSGLASASDPEGLKSTIEQLSTMSTLLGEDIPAVSRSAAQAIRTGIAQNATEAFDLMTRAQQQGLNVSGDLLDTVDEYSTQFRKLGLTGPEAFGLLSQAVKGGARDTDVAADALKEFSIRVVDGSKTTNDAFKAIGLDADAMARRFAAGGRIAATAFDETVDKIRAIQDPVEQSRRAVELFGTQAEDLGGALNKFDLTTAVDEFGRIQGASQEAADKMVSNSLNEWQEAGRNIQTMLAGIRDSLNMSQWFDSIPKAVNSFLGPDVVPPPMAPPGPSAVPQITANPGNVPGPPVAQNPLDIFAPTKPRTGGPSFERVDQRGVTDSPLRHRSAAPGAIDPTVDIQNYLRSIAAQAGLEVTSGVRPGDPGQHGGGFAADLAGSVPQMRAFAEAWAANPALVGITRQLIFSDGAGGFNENSTIYGGRTGAAGTYANDLAGHQDHVHLALEGAPAQRGALPVTINGVAAGAFPSTEFSGASSAGSTGVPLDEDLGLSNGLAGLADNLVRMAGNALAAPLMGQLSAISAASAIQGGHGMAGILGAQNMAAGLSPLGMGPLGGPPMLGGAPVLGGPIGAPPVAPPVGTPTTYGWGAGGLPATAPSGQGFGAATPGMVGQAAGPTGPVGYAPGTGGWQPNGGGGIGVGGGAMDAAMMAAGGLDLLAPGAGQAAQTGMKLINRTIQFGGQLASIGVEGLMQTFLPSGSELGDPSKSWLGRAAAGVAGMKPATPTSAGQTQAPGQQQEHQGTGAPPGPQGPTVQIGQFVQAENRNGQQTAQDLAFKMNTQGR